MLTTTVAGRTWNFSHAIGRNSAAGAGFTQPTAVAVAPDGILYVLSRGQEGPGGVVADNKRIGKVSMDQDFIRDFARREFIWPAGLAVSGDGELYCSDEYGHYIAHYSPDGDRLGHWGEPGADEGQLNGPSGIAFDAEGSLFVVDSLNDRVQKFTDGGQYLTGWGGPGDGDGQFQRPWGITLDGKGDVYVADWGNNRVQKFSPDGAFLLSFGGSGDEGVALNHPAGVAVDSEGDVYVADWGNKLVRIYDSSGEVLTALTGDAQELSKWGKAVIEANPDGMKAYRRVKDLSPLGKFERPVGIAVDEQDRIIITDSTRGRLQVYAKEKNFLDAQFNL